MQGVHEDSADEADADTNIKNDATEKIDLAIKEDLAEASTTEVRRVWRGRSHKGTEIEVEELLEKKSGLEQNLDAGLKSAAKIVTGTSGKS